MKVNKKGISLIVLVITIIVMIILATAIILSLNSNDVVEKAKEAKTASDLANAKNVVILAKGEWELMTSSERASNGGTFKAYANSKLLSAGYAISGENAYGVTEDGKVVQGVAALFLNNNVPIGTTVTGYNLRQDAEYKKYTTSGKENTCDADTEMETNPQPATITRDENVTWQYMGIDKDGKALLIGSVTDTTPKILLAGKGGYFSGEETLNLACEALYSTDMGTARSINMDDVTSVLEYTGERTAYSNMFDIIPTSKILTVAEIEKIENCVLESRETPDDADLDQYEINSFYIRKNVDASKYNTSRTDMIYPSASISNLKYEYWSATTGVELEIGSSITYNGMTSFGVYKVGMTWISVIGSFNSWGESLPFYNYAIRPVIELNSDVKMTYNGTNVVLSK